MRRSLVGKRILVTGASSGIGYELALQLAGKGAVVLGTARRGERLSELVRVFSERFPHSSGKLEVEVADVTQPGDRHRLLQRVCKEWQGIDGLINNAGAGAIGPFSDASEDRLRRVMEVDFFSAVELTRLFLPELKKGEQPFMAVIGSVLAYCAVPNKSEYCAAKFALRGWAESLRRELRTGPIRVLTISPSTTRTEFFQQLIDTAPNTTSRSIGSMSSDQVAAKAIRAIEKDRSETIISLTGKWLVWLNAHFPQLMDRFL